MNTDIDNMCYYSYEFDKQATSTESLSSHNFYLYSFYDITVVPGREYGSPPLGMTIRVNPTDEHPEEHPGKLNVQVRNYSDHKLIGESGEYEITKSEMRHDLNMNFSVNAQTGFYITAIKNKCEVYYTPSGIPFQLMQWGKTRATASGIGNSQAYFCDMTIHMPKMWVKDDQNEGYLRPSMFDMPDDFKEFQKDANGYPYNWGVWKFDKQNDKYPWVIGYEEIERSKNLLFVLLSSVYKEAESFARFDSEISKCIMRINDKSHDDT